ncbi:hypothetical protein H7R52_18740 [Weissella confusa]|uniref:Uncharacterized protein n=1 Tax=Weissella confusa TaxID=1583 RepID=A0A923NLA7_WEICO|nr:hypothetical protein [Weissella confusa]
MELEVSNDRTLPGTELLVDTIKDTFGTVANTFGISFGKTKNEEKAKPELVLTNLNLILCSKGLFGNKKGVTYYPLNRIKVYNDSAQVIETTKGNQPVMEVMFIDGQEAFGFQRQPFSGYLGFLD